MSKTILTREQATQFRRDVGECVKLATHRTLESPPGGLNLAILVENIVNILIRTIPDCFIDDETGEIWISEGK